MGEGASDGPVLSSDALNGVWNGDWKGENGWCAASVLLNASVFCGSAMYVPGVGSSDCVSALLLSVLFPIPLLLSVLLLSVLLLSVLLVSELLVRVLVVRVLLVRVLLVRVLVSV